MLHGPCMICTLSQCHGLLHGTKGSKNGMQHVQGSAQGSAGVYTHNVALQGCHGQGCGRTATQYPDGKHRMVLQTDASCKACTHPCISERHEQHTRLPCQWLHAGNTRKTLLWLGWQLQAYTGSTTWCFVLDAFATTTNSTRGSMDAAQAAAQQQHKPYLVYSVTLNAACEH